MRLRSLSLLAALCFAGAAGCAGDGPAGSSSEQWFVRVQTEIFNLKCISAGCHNPVSNAGDLILTEGFSFNALVEVAPVNPAALEQGLLRVVPFAPEQSFLITKVQGPGAGEGSQMPQGAAPLSADEIGVLQSWIENGAPRADGTLIGTPTLVPSAGTASPTPSPTATHSATASATATAPPPSPSATATPDLPTATASTPPLTPAATATPTPSATASATPTIAAYTFAELQEQIFTPRCATVFCHDAQGMSGSLVLTAEVSYDELVGVDPENAAARADGLLRVDPFDPDNSFLIVKLGNPPPVYGLRMPMTGLPLTAEEISLIRGWIETGATR